MIFDYCNSVADTPRVCTYDQFRHLTRLPEVGALISQFRNGDATAKRKLPAFCFHATFGGKPRKVENARPSGLFILDFDHLPDDVMYEMKNKLVTPSSDIILLAHVTPSGHGLRLVCKATRREPFAACRSIGDYQRTMAREMEMDEYFDGVTHDLARLSFCPCEAEILWLDRRLFTEEPEVTNFAPESPAATGIAQGAAQLPAGLAADDTGQEEFEGIPLRDIFARYFDMTGGLPAEGGRNARFYAAARDLRYICDFSPAVIARHLPDVGLSEGELFSVAQSACLSSRASRVPAVVAQAVESLRQQADDTKEPDAQAADVVAANGNMRLPAVYRELVALHPPQFREAALLAMLPIMGTLATGIRARYLDGEMHSPSFMTVVTAEQASGKSFARRIVHTLLRSIEEEDAAQREIEKAYQRELRKKKNAKEQPQDPRAKVRLVPASVSIAKLLQRMDYADGEHLFSFAEELDTVIKTNRGGAWSEKNDIYRNAFDNAEYGQDYMSDMSYSATLRVFYNMLFLGTPRQTKRFFNNVENGLVSRCCFAALPDQFGAQMPKINVPDEACLKKINTRIAQMRAAKGEIDFSFVLPVLSEWLERQRKQSLLEVNRARDIFRRRCAVIGFRAAMTVAPFYLLNVKRNREVLSQFAVHIADICLKNQLAFAGDELNRIIDTNQDQRKRTDEIFTLLPAEFDANDLTGLLHRHGLKSPARQLIYIWSREKMVKKIEGQKLYRKTK